MVLQQPRLRIAVIFGGRSAEHDVSILSATNVVRALPADKYDVVPVFITRDGLWLLSRFEEGQLTVPQDGLEITLISGGKGRLLILDAEGNVEHLPKLDILFPVLHGLHGEDGAIQGLAQVAQVPFVGCGVLGSAAALDKDVAKRLLREAGLPVARAITLIAAHVPDFATIKATLGLPVFIKPARQGSSVGVSKVKDEAEYHAALLEGFRHDTKLLVEEFVTGREIECSVLEDAQGDLMVSRTGEIIPAQSHGFYSYNAKYIDADGALVQVPADIPDDTEQRIRALALDAFRALACDGMARVDVFLTSDERILINEINTIPGFTDISMYAKAMSASGVSYPALLDRLISHGLARG